MDTLAQGKKKLLYNFLFLFIFCIYIKDDVNRWTPLSEKSRSAIANIYSHDDTNLFQEFGNGGFGCHFFAL